MKELEDALEDLEGLDEVTTNAAEDVIGEQAEKASWTLEDHAKPLLSTDGGAKVDDFVADSAKVVEEEAKVESKKGHGHTSRQSDGSQQDIDGLEKKVGDSEGKKSEKVLDVVLTNKELEALAVLTEPSIVHKEREILDELKAKVQDAQISSLLEEEREQSEEVWIDEDEFVHDEEEEEADAYDTDLAKEKSGEEISHSSIKKKILNLVSDQSPQEKDEVDQQMVDDDKKSSDFDEEKEFEKEDMIGDLTTSSSRKEEEAKDEEEDSKRREKLQAMVKKLESQIEKVDETVGDKLNVIQVLDLGGLGEFIPTEQLRAAIIDVLNTHNDEEEADAIIDRLDLNKDGFVDVNVSGFYENGAE